MRRCETRSSGDRKHTQCEFSPARQIHSKNFLILLVLVVAACSIGCSGLVSSSSNSSMPVTIGVSNVGTSSLTANAATIAWTTNVPGSSQVFYGASSSYGQSTTVNNTMLTSHLVNLSNLTSSTLYHYQVVSIDGSGKVARSGDLTFSTPAAGTTPPTVAITAPVAGATVSGSITVSANASASAGLTLVSVQFLLDSSNLGSAIQTAPWTYSWNTKGVSSGTHSLSAVATDSDGNKTTSATVSVSVNNSVPPTISITAPASGATVSGTVTVTTSVSANTISVQFQVDGNNTGAAVTSAPFSYSLNTTTLTNAAHLITAVASNAVGQATTSAAVSVTVNNASDTTAPTVPTGLTATAVSASQINLSWTASTDNVGVTGYTVFRGGSQIGTTASTSYQNTSLAASTTYSYTVAAQDAAGNQSAQSAPASATTLPASSGGGITLVQANGNNYSGCLSVTACGYAMAKNVTSGDAIVVGVDTSGSSSPVIAGSGAGCSSTPWVHVGNVGGGGGAPLESQWVGVASGSGSCTVTVTLSVASNVGIITLEYSGTTTTPIDVSGIYSAISATPTFSTTGATSVANEMAVVTWSAGNVSPSAAASGWASEVNQSFSGAFQAGGSPSGRTVTFTGSNFLADHYTSLVMVLLKPASGGGGTAPSIASLNPVSGSAGTSVTITGTNFGATQATSTVTFNGTVATPTTWSTTSIVVAAPIGATTGNVVVTVGGVASNGVNFTVTGAGSISVTLSPKRGGVVVTQHMQLSASVANDVGAAGVIWSVSSGGTLTGQTTTTASFSAATAGVYTVTATSVADSFKLATATIGVTNLQGVYTYHDDLARDGSNTQEYALTTSSVNTTTFGKLFSCAVDGAIYAQPLWVANLTVNSATHNVVFVATQHDSLYAFDADASPCVPLWHVNLIDSTHGATSGETTVPSGPGGNKVGGGNGDIMPEVGVTGTPVIDSSTNTLYVVSKSMNSAGTSFFQRLHAIDITSGSEKFAGPLNITSSITFPGKGDGGSTVSFSAKQENQRPGLALVNGVVYVAWASHEDAAPYYGWVVGFNASTLAVTNVLNVSPNVQYGGIWMGGGAPSADGNNNIYLIIGNATFDATNGSAPNNDYGDSFLQLTSSLAVSSYFSPSDQASDNANDQDFGAGGAAVVLNLTSGSLKHLVIGGGKDGGLYLLNGDNMGGFGDSNAYQHFNIGHGIFATGAFWNNSFYIAGVHGPLTSYSFNTSTNMFNTSISSQSSTSYGFPGASPSVSSSGTSNGIVWALDNANYCTTQAPGCGPAVLHAYDATSLTNDLWNSSLVSADAGGNAVKFTLPTVANGKVYVGTRGNNTGGVFGSTSVSGELDIYGLKPN
jgi:hypothetical protein